MILHVPNLSLFLLKLRNTLACLRVQVVDLYWGVDPEEWDSPELQRLRMKLLEECLKTSAGPCFVVSMVVLFNDLLTLCLRDKYKTL